MAGTECPSVSLESYGACKEGMDTGSLQTGARSCTDRQLVLCIHKHVRNCVHAASTIQWSSHHKHRSIPPLSKMLVPF